MNAIWPKVAAVALAIFAWQCVVWSGWKPPYALAPPREAFGELWELTKDGTVFKAIGVTMSRAARGFGLALIVAFSVGLAATITAIGLVAVLARRAFGRARLDGPLVRALPALSAAVIVAVGLVITVKAIPAVV